MIFAKLTFPSPINMSCRVGDTAYWCPLATPQGGFNIASNINPIGTITSTDDNGTNTIVTCNLTGTTPNSGNYIFFSKDNYVEKSSLTGYYAQVTFNNNSNKAAEMYATSCGITESSK